MLLILKKKKEMKMPTLKLKSSNIHSISYNAEDQNLEVGFNSGKLYLYHNVPEELHQQFLAAESKGKFFKQNIRGKFSYICLGNTFDIWCERIESKSRITPLEDCRAIDANGELALQEKDAKFVYLRFVDGVEFELPFQCYVDRLADVPFIPAEI